jgi:hypothetical protein
MTETKPPQLAADLVAPGITANLDMFLDLTATREVNTLLRQALALLVQAFRAEAGSLLFAGRTSQRLRIGSPQPEALALMDRWERVVEHRPGGVQYAAAA